MNQSLNLINAHCLSGSIGDNYNDILKIDSYPFRISNCWTRVNKFEELNELIRKYNEKSEHKKELFYGWTHLDCMIVVAIDIIFFICFIFVLYVYVNYCRRKAWFKIKNQIKNKDAGSCCSRKIIKPTIGKIFGLMLIYNFGKYTNS